MNMFKSFTQLYPDGNNDRSFLPNLIDICGNTIVIGVKASAKMNMDKLCISTDLGVTWNTITAPTSYAFSSSCVSGDGTTIFYHTTDGVGKISYNRGVSWQILPADTVGADYSTLSYSGSILYTSNGQGDAVFRYDKDADEIYNITPDEGSVTCHGLNCNSEGSTVHLTCKVPIWGGKFTVDRYYTSAVCGDVWFYNDIFGANSGVTYFSCMTPNLTKYTLLADYPYFSIDSGIYLFTYEAGGPGDLESLSFGEGLSYIKRSENSEDVIVCDSGSGDYIYINRGEPYAWSTYKNPYSLSYINYGAISSTHALIATDTRIYLLEFNTGGISRGSILKG